VGYIKAVRSGDTLEIYEFEKDLPDKKSQSEKQVEGFYGISNQKPRRKHIVQRKRYDNVCRARASFRRLVRSNLTRNEAPQLLTLTMLEIVGIAQAYKYLNDFIHRARRYIGTDFRYIAVPEFQNRGAVHFHILVWGLPPSIYVYERNERNLQHIWARGFLDCSSTDGSPKLISYLTKYMQKGMYDERISGKKAYTCGRNTLRPVSLQTKTQVGEYIRDWGIDVDNNMTFQSKHDTKWLGRMSYKVIKI